jgi:hypothetical protein
MSKFKAAAHVTDGGAEPTRTVACDGDGLVAGSRLGFIGEVRRVQGKGEVASAEMSGSARCRQAEQEGDQTTAATVEHVVALTGARELSPISVTHSKSFLALQR